MLNDINTLTTIQQERYNGFVNEAATLRLLPGQKRTGTPRKAVASSATAAKAATTFYGLLLSALQTRIRALRPS